MTPADTLPTRYPALTRALHWIVAALVIATIPAGVIMLQPDMPRGLRDTLFILHKNGGVIILALVVLRLVWRVLYPAPPLPSSLSPLQAQIARGAHFGLYALLLVMAISGYIRVRAGGFPIEMLDAIGLPGFVPRSDSLADTAKWVHATARYALIALILAHVGAALHHLRKGDGVFARIWPPLGRGRA